MWALTIATITIEMQQPQEIAQQNQPKLIPNSNADKKDCKGLNRSTDTNAAISPSKVETANGNDSSESHEGDYDLDDE